jgi:F-type H+-transporting ATPase subunit delta
MTSVTSTLIFAYGLPCVVLESLARAPVARSPERNTGRVDVSEPASISTGIAARYATAVFDLAKEDKALKSLEGDIDALGGALEASSDLRDLISSPIYSRDEQRSAVMAVGSKLGLSTTMGNTLALMASKRRLFVVPQMLSVLRDKVAEEKGEVTADVTSATPLTAAQQKTLSKSLAETFGKTVKLNLAVDESLIGGLVVKVGSKMIDTSIKAKLTALQNTMKEVG